MPQIAYLDDLITEEEWAHILKLELSSALTKLLTFFYSKGGETTLVNDLPEYFLSSHVEQLNGRFSSLELPYRVGNAGNKPWTTVSPYEKRSIKLYKVKKSKKKEVPLKECKPRIGPPIYFNPNVNRSPSHTDGNIKLGFVGTKHEMTVRASISIGPRPGSGFIHIVPTRAEMDMLITYLQQVREMIPE